MNRRVPFTCWCTACPCQACLQSDEWLSRRSLHRCHRYKETCPRTPRHQNTWQTEGWRLNFYFFLKWFTSWCVKAPLWGAVWHGNHPQKLWLAFTSQGAIMSVAVGWFSPQDKSQWLSGNFPVQEELEPLKKPFLGLLLFLLLLSGLHILLVLLKKDRRCGWKEETGKAFRRVHRQLKGWFGCIMLFIKQLVVIEECCPV